MTLKPEEKKEKFLTRLRSIFPDNYEDIVRNIEKAKPQSFRINTIKAGAKETLSSLETQGFTFEKGPLENSYISTGNTTEKRLSETEEFRTGKIYIQSLSSMVPALLLDPQPEEKIIDLCASPGSKTGQIASLSENRAHIIAVENNRQRFFNLQENMSIQGVENISFLMENSVLLPRKNPQLINYFDKVLADVPCSNEGLICLSQEETFKSWNPKTSKHLAKLQKSIISAGIRMLKPGGIIVYSTCTFSREENEEVIEWALKRFPELELIEMRRVNPDENFTAFFAAKLTKRN